VDIRRMQEEVERARQDLERRTQDLNRKLDQIKKASSDPANTPLPAERKSSATKGVQAGPRPGAMAGPGSPPAMGVTGNPGADLEKRLREVERKLDTIIQMMRRGQPGAFPGGPVPPAASNTELPLVQPPATAAPPGRRSSPPIAPVAPGALPATTPRFQPPQVVLPPAVPRQQEPEEVENLELPLRR
jgi:hypothetical protein